MRSTQLATLKAIHAGSDTVKLVAGRLGIPLSSAGNRVRILVRDNCVRRVGLMGGGRILELTLKGQAALDGES